MAGEAIAQCLMVPVSIKQPYIVNELFSPITDTLEARGEGGFGSTGLVAKKETDNAEEEKEE